MEGWAATPLAVRALVMALLQRLAQVEARLNQTSRNSSKPPSADPPNAGLRRPKESSGRKSGGQPGHEGHGRRMKAESAVDQLSTWQNITFRFGCRVPLLACPAVLYSRKVIS
jgi:hypothetical protein